ncbi:zinc carboxypeptidase-like [Toxorhynchites rutilus septentrionalis]|uniref:zinc carboxypeptidase-like n=1 Tax=Toxorhynchites rutilus septentrionalis TaxID=329112 RepID=UPI002479970B|nr:zinc carboxypeptidase-like [Toxorhynchites rutilus septentrionalis]
MQLLKKLIISALAIICIIPTVCFACEPPASSHSNKARYDYFRIYRLFLETEVQVNLMQQMENRSDSYTFMGHARHANQNLTIMVAPQKIAEITDLLERYSIQGSVLLYNIQDIIEKELPTIKPKGTDPSQFDWKHYFQLDTIHKWLDLQASKYPFLTVIPLQASYQRNLIKGVKLSKKAGNSAVFVECGIHAREWISPAVCTYILNQLLVSEAPEVRDLADNFDWFFFPVVNPDGYKYTFESDRLWRKNRKPYGLCRGVDLNRNFESDWNGIGASSDPCAYDFAGASAASEPETQVLQQFLKENAKSSRIKTYFSMHSFSQLIMFPYGYTKDRVPNYEDLKQIGELGSQAIRNTHGKEYVSGAMIETIYPSSGDSVDWAYSECDVPIAFTFELRGPPDSTNMFILPAEEIIPTGEETLAAYVAMLQSARNLGYYSTIEQKGEL